MICLLCETLFLLKRAEKLQYHKTSLSAKDSIFLLFTRDLTHTAELLNNGIYLNNKPLFIGVCWKSIYVI